MGQTKNIRDAVEAELTFDPCTTQHHGFRRFQPGLAA